MIKRRHQSGSSSAGDIQSHEDAVADIERELKEHKLAATDFLLRDCCQM